MMMMMMMIFVCEMLIYTFYVKNIVIAINCFICEIFTVNCFKNNKL